MATFAEARKYYKTNSASGVIKAEGFGKRSNVSVRAALAGPEKRIYHPQDDMRVHDVEADKDDLVVIIQSDGGVQFSGKVWDHGSIYGDDFMVSAFYPGLLPGGGPTPIWTFGGHVGHQSWNPWSVQFFEPAIRDNWDVAKDFSHLHWHLHKNGGLTALEVIFDVFVGVAAATAAYVGGFFVASAIANNQVHATCDENNNPNGMGFGATSPFSQPCR